MKRSILVSLSCLMIPALAGASTFVSGNFGKVAPQKAGFAAAAKASMEGILVDHFGAAGNESVELIGTSTDVKGNTHARFMQTLNGLPVVGAEFVMHMDAAGTIFSVNGDFAPAADAASPLKALRSAPLGAELVYVVGADGKAHLAWQNEVSYDNADGAQLDLVFTSVATGEEVARHPQLKYARSLRTLDCNSRTQCNTVVSTSSNAINTGDAAADAAHNYAIATYDYFLANHGRDSIDDNGMTLISRVHYNRNYNNAFWDGSQMTYGDGDGTTFIPLSQDADVVAHELTHGVTERSSNLIYQNESGALNEALSDIFGAMVDRQEGANAVDTWLLGEDIYTPGTPGDALRVMNDPAAAGDYDYYPTRYTGTSDNGGVHWNSGIANLAYVLLVEGGTHPRGKTSNTVPAIGFDAAADIFYYANTSCLTSSSNFEAARNCTAQGAALLYGATEVAAVHEAWDAVGVPGGGGTGGGGGGGGGGTGCETPYSDSLSGISGSKNSENRYSQDVPACATTLTISISGSNGDADLYVKFGSAPTTSSFDCRPYLNGSNETCTFTPPQAGSYEIMIRGYRSYSNLTLSASYQ